jgi:hybrid cluster-associated redox disulfide protein
MQILIIKEIYIYMKTINKNMIIGEIIKMDPGIANILLNAGMHCLGCPSSQMESIEDAAMVHGFDVNDLLKELNDYIESVENK